VLGWLRSRAITTFLLTSVAKVAAQVWLQVFSPALNEAQALRRTRCRLWVSKLDSKPLTEFA
jgi:hypothetical protein